MTDWSWTVRGREVVGQTGLDPDPLVTLEWGPGAFPWGEPAFPTLLLLGVSAPVTPVNPGRPVHLVISQTVPVSGALERLWPSATVIGGPGRMDLATGIFSGAQLPYGLRLMHDPAGLVPGALTLNFGASFAPSSLGPVMIWGVLE